MTHVRKPDFEIISTLKNMWFLEPYDYSDRGLDLKLDLKATFLPKEEI